MAVPRSTVHEAPSRDPDAVPSRMPSPGPSSGPRPGASHHGALPWEEARLIAASAAEPLAPVDLPLHLAYGCRLAAPLHALVPVPGADVAWGSTAGWPPGPRPRRPPG
ncbi:hypothetical protein [Streptosporangium sp. NPDC048865]|uniref:hypothetical protein n=1 Tax=Streptosporangium sp. NPDC048865 TaxID=3155766 RepID=UPI00341EE40A